MRVSHAQALHLLLSGYTITETADRLGVSRTLVYNRRKDFIDYAEKEGMKLAAEHYEVDEKFDELMELSRALKQNGLNIEDAKRGAELVNLMEEIQVKDPKAFTSAVIGEAQRRGISGEEITRYADELKTLEEETGNSYSQLLERIEEKKEENKDLEKAHMLLEEQVQVVRGELEKSLDEAEVTKESLRDYVATKEGLNNLGVSLDDLERLEAVLNNIKELEYNPAEIIDFYGRAKSAREKLEININDYERLKERNEALREENHELEANLEENLEMATVVKSQLDAGVKPGYILEIVSTIKDMGIVLGLDEEEALQRFMNDLKIGYTERSGYTFRLDELKEMHRTLEEKNSLLRERLDVLEEVLDDRKSAVDSLRQMEALGLEGSEIIEWMKILESCEYDVTGFRAEIAKMGGLSELVEEKTGDITALEAKKKELQASVDELENRIRVMQYTLEATREAIEEETGKIKNAVKDFEQYFTSPQTGFKARSRMIVDDIVSNLTEILMDTRREWDRDLEDLDEKVDKIVEEIDRILANAYKGGRTVGRFHALEPIHKLLRDDTVPKTEGTIGVLTMLAYIKLWLEKNYPMELADSFNPVMERLTRDLGEVHQK